MGTRVRHMAGATEGRRQVDQRQAIIYALVAALVGTGGGTGITAITTLRGDAFTGSDGQVMAARIRVLEKRTDIMAGEINAHTAQLLRLPPIDLLERVTRLEITLEGLNSNQERMLSKLDQLMENSRDH